MCGSSSQTGSSLSVSWAWKEGKIPRSLPGPTPSLLSFLVSVDGVLGNKTRVKKYFKTMQEASPRYQESPIPKLQTSWRQGWALQLKEPHIHALHPNISHSHCETNEPPTSPVRRWSRPQPVNPLGGQPTFLKIEQKVLRRKLRKDPLRKWINILCLKNASLDYYT